MIKLNQDHLKILEQVTKVGLPVTKYSNSIRPRVSLNNCLAAMQILQNEIDRLQTKYTALHDLIKFCQCDDPDFYTGDNTQCKRCNRPFDPELS